MTPTASSCAAPTSAASTSPTRMRSGSSASTTRSASCPAVDLDEEAARKAAHGVTVPGRAKGYVRLRDADGLIALAEPRGGATLKPVVGFRG